MDSKKAKQLIKDRAFGFNSVYAGVIEEVVNTWNADAIAVKWNGEIIEYEIKCSKYDLIGEVKAITFALDNNAVFSNNLDFIGRNLVTKDTKLSRTKIAKHHHYLVEQVKDYSNMEYMFRPNRFYFAVPTELVELAKELLRGIKYYGVYNLDTGEIVKKSYSLHKNSHSASVYLHLFTRACTERDDQLRENIKLRKSLVI